MKKQRELPRISFPQMEQAPYSLSGVDLAVFADVWMYSRVNPYVGSYQNLADWINIPKTTVVRSVKYLADRGLVEVININAHKTSFRAKAIPGYPLPICRFTIVGETDNNEAFVVKKVQAMFQNESRLDQNGPRLDQNGPSQYNIYNNNSSNRTHKKEILNNCINTPERVREIEEQMREENHRLRDLHDIEASKPEAIAARDKFFEKFCKRG